MCLSDRNCKGIMYDAVWAAEYRGVKMCTTKELIAKPERDWSVFLLKEKCDSGMYVK